MLERERMLSERKRTVNGKFQGNANQHKTGFLLNKNSIGPMHTNIVLKSKYNNAVCISDMSSVQTLYWTCQAMVPFRCFL